MPWDKVRLARHPQRPHTLDFVRQLCYDFFELRGDRSFADDQAIVGGIGTTDLGAVAVLGHQKGHDTKQNIRHGFGMPYPEGYHKAVRVMRHAEKFGMPLLCFLDTPGAQPDCEAEERGQSQAIAACLMTLATLRVPVVATVIGEGGSGGALAIGLADRLILLEHAIYSVASPEASAAILWRDPSEAPEAARAMKITAQDLLEFGIADEIIPEPKDGAHTDPTTAIRLTIAAISRHLVELRCLPLQQLLQCRYDKYRSIGCYHRAEHGLDSASSCQTLPSPQSKTLSERQYQESSQ